MSKRVRFYCDEEPTDYIAFGLEDGVVKAWTDGSAVFNYEISTVQYIIEKLQEMVDASGVKKVRSSIDWMRIAHKSKDSRTRKQAMGHAAARAHFELYGMPKESAISKQECAHFVIGFKDECKDIELQMKKQKKDVK